MSQKFRQLAPHQRHRIEIYGIAALLTLVFTFFVSNQVQNMQSHTINSLAAERKLTAQQFLQITSNPQWPGINGEPGDYKVVDASNKTLIYLSPSYGNHGQIVALTSINGNKNLVNSVSPLASGAYYDHFLLWPNSLAANAWTNGKKANYFRVLIPNTMTSSYVEWEGSWHDDAFNFDSTVNQKITQFLYNGDNLLVIKAQSKFIAGSIINQFRQLWIELGWHANDYHYVTAQTTTGDQTVDMTGNIGNHHFWGQKLSSGSHVVAYNSSNLDASMSLIFDSTSIANQGISNIPIDSNSVYVHSWDTWNTDTTDHTDTMELHITNPNYSQNSTGYYSIPAGTNITINYYVVVNNNPNSNSWVPSLPTLQALFEIIPTPTPSPTQIPTIPACSKCNLLNKPPIDCLKRMCPNGSRGRGGLKTNCTIAGVTNQNCYTGCCGGMIDRAF